MDERAPLAGAAQVPIDKPRRGEQRCRPAPGGGGAGGPPAGLTDGWQRGNGRELIDGSVPGSASGTGQLLEEGGRGKKPDAEQRGGRRMRAACLAEGLKWEQAAAPGGLGCRQASRA